MNSCLYECAVMHHRMAPIQNHFHYKYFMFYVDLDELATLPAKSALIGHNRGNVYAFRDSDHVHKRGSVKESVLEFIRQNGIDRAPERIMLLTNFRTLGYAFNPVSFYFCFDTADQPICAVVEVHNTFGEMKPYFLGPETLSENGFRDRTTKFFYVSPFIDMDTDFDFRLQVPNGRLAIHIDDYRDGKKFFASTLTGSRRPLSTTRLLWYAIRFPLVTVKVIAMIHWQAFKLWMRGLPYFRKSDQIHLQQEVYHRKGA